jgi:hypothetical protein
VGADVRAVGEVGLTRLVVENVQAEAVRGLDDEGTHLLEHVVGVDAEVVDAVGASAPSGPSIQASRSSPSASASGEVMSG